MGRATPINIYELLGKTGEIEESVKKWSQHCIAQKAAEHSSDKLILLPDKGIEGVAFS
ncbi:MAG: hypothetical protein HOF21_15355 [Nitrospina sp.]|nr:hypothetical protein [Nitrospina sp.]